MANPDTWWVDVIRSVSIAVLSSLLSIFGSFYAIGKSDRLRRLAGWEPYAKELWIRRADLCTELVVKVSKAQNCGSNWLLFASAGKAATETDKLWSEFMAAAKDLHDLIPRSTLLLSAKACDDLMAVMATLSTLNPVALERREISVQGYRAMIDPHLRQLAGSMRAEIRADQLDEKLIGALQGTVRTDRG
ncbi:MAG TPA: hypothetical protein VHD36_12420 [Pirellulales bacterium]|nr:hypothetical protein [Pirellulales bacterium]